ncbi:MAG: hypothetical protein JRI23_23760, partial [Deltaproteobacteria bacterium]|nr:hypothetical protein [Deltaproteobacteria bacterium]
MNDTTASSWSRLGAATLLATCLGALTFTLPADAQPAPQPPPPEQPPPPPPAQPPPPPPTQPPSPTPQPPS